jgi:predicted nuclease of predicted toxin-antitoxin system
VRFVCDHDVDAAVAVVLRRLGHEAWTASDAGLATAVDDELAVYAHDQGAVLVTHDKEFSQRRKHNIIGKHLWLRCVEFDAAGLLEKRHGEVIATLNFREDIWVRVFTDGLETSSAWE